MSAENNVNPAQFDPEARQAHANYGISYTQGDERRGIPATSRLNARNRAVRESAESGKPEGWARQAYDTRSARATAAKRLGREADYIRGLRPATPYGNASAN